MLVFFTVMVANDDSVSLGMSSLHDASPTAISNKTLNFKYLFIFLGIKFNIPTKIGHKDNALFLY